MGQPPAPGIICFIVFFIPSIAAAAAPHGERPSRGQRHPELHLPQPQPDRDTSHLGQGLPGGRRAGPRPPLLPGWLAQSQRDQQGREEASVTLSELMERDSDLYHCYITYPQGEQAKGTGTTLTVIGRAVAEIPAGCKRAPNPNVGAFGQKQDGLRVSQEPKSLNATVGENVTLSCTFQNRNGSRAKVLWFRGSGEDVVLDAKHPFYQGRLHVSRLVEISKGNATLTLGKLDKRDSGLYQCCIEIQNETTGMGEGTDLRVLRRNQSVTDNRKESKQDTSTELTIYRATTALAGVSIIILVTALLLRRRTAASPDTQQQQPAKVRPLKLEPEFNWVALSVSRQR
ncbi:uncharacterized protein LOC115643924 [Gopherus evgoodei]|uniref:uncharacterized protein LOC115643924 n=1 Tax=Gopherus evgoodei TaxID=1825980 RepID=UPI0011CF81D0|nr:uncharacterized protein LOC115643924 [Gopherus evgoodei]